MASRISFKTLFAEPFLVLYLLMLGTVFYLAFVNTSNAEDMGKAADSAVYTSIWIGMYVLLIGFIIADLPKIPKGLVTIAVLVAINAITYSIYGVQTSSLVKLLTFVMTLVFAGWAANRFTTDRFFELFFRTVAVVAVAFLLAYPALHSLAKVYDRMERPNLLGFAPYAGLFAHKNYAGTFFALGVVIGIAQMLSRRAQFTFLRGAAILVMLACILMTGAVGPLIAALLCTALMILLLIFRLRIELGLLIGAVTVGLLVVLFLFPDLWVGAVGRDATFTGRQYLYDNWFLYFSQRPLTGYGHGEAFNGMPHSIGAQINALYGASWAHYQNFESGILQCGIDFGVAGFLFYAFLFVRAAMYAARNVTGVYIRDRLLPAAITFYLLISSMNELFIVLGNTLPLAFLFFFYCKAALRYEVTEAPRAPLLRRRSPLTPTAPADEPEPRYSGITVRTQ